MPAVSTGGSGGGGGGAPIWITDVIPALAVAAAAASPLDVSSVDGSSDDGGIAGTAHS